MHTEQAYLIFAKFDQFALDKLFSETGRRVLSGVERLKVIKIDELPETEIVRELFSGKVTAKRVVSKDLGSQDLSLSIISFPKGVRNYFHAHEFDQALWVLSGKGIVADEKNEYEALPGMVFFIPRGEKHWHGASEDSDFSHISILRPGKPTKMFKD